MDIDAKQFERQLSQCLGMAEKALSISQTSTNPEIADFARDTASLAIKFARLAETLLDRIPPHRRIKLPKAA